MDGKEKLIIAKRNSRNLIRLVLVRIFQWHAEIFFSELKWSLLPQGCSLLQSALPSFFLSVLHVEHPPKESGKLNQSSAWESKNSPYGSSNTKESTNTSSHNCDSLSLHICGDDHEFCICHPEGYAIFMLPAGGILGTIGKTLEVIFCTSNKMFNFSLLLLIELRLNMHEII